MKMTKITLVGWDQQQALVDGLNIAFAGKYTFTQVSGDHRVVVDGEAFTDLRLWDEKEGCTILSTWFDLLVQYR